jgi:hypothetical protein
MDFLIFTCCVDAPLQVREGDAAKPIASRKRARGSLLSNPSATTKDPDPQGQPDVRNTRRRHSSHNPARAPSPAKSTIPPKVPLPTPAIPSPARSLPMSSPGPQQSGPVISNSQSEDAPAGELATHMATPTSRAFKPTNPGLNPSLPLRWAWAAIFPPEQAPTAADAGHPREVSGGAPVPIAHGGNLAQEKIAAEGGKKASKKRAKGKSPTPLHPVAAAKGRNPRKDTEQANMKLAEAQRLTDHAEEYAAALQPGPRRNAEVDLPLRKGTVRFSTPALPSVDEARLLAAPFPFGTEPTQVDIETLVMPVRRARRRTTPFMSTDASAPVLQHAEAGPTGKAGLRPHPHLPSPKRGGPANEGGEVLAGLQRFPANGGGQFAGDGIHRDNPGEATPGGPKRGARRSRTRRGQEAAPLLDSEGHHSGRGFGFPAGCLGMENDDDRRGHDTAAERGRVGAQGEMDRGEDNTAHEAFPHLCKRGPARVAEEGQAGRNGEVGAQNAADWVAGFMMEAEGGCLDRPKCSSPPCSVQAGQAYPTETPEGARRDHLQELQYPTHNSGTSLNGDRSLKPSLTIWGAARERNEKLATISAFAGSQGGATALETTPAVPGGTEASEEAVQCIVQYEGDHGRGDMSRVGVDQNAGLADTLDVPKSMEVARTRQGTQGGHQVGRMAQGAELHRQRMSVEEIMAFANQLVTQVQYIF